MKKRQFILFFLVLAMLCALIGGCAPQEEEPEDIQEEMGEESMQEEQRIIQTLRLPIFPDQSLNPITGTSDTNLTLAGLLYEGLFSVDESLTASPLLCQSYTVDESFTSWRFTLKSGVSFSDGTLLTAEHVVQSLIRSQSADSIYAARLSGAQIYAEDDVVCIELSSPRSGLCELLDIPIVSDEGDRPAGTGPYAFLEQDGALSLALRPDWHGDEQISMQVIELFPLDEFDDLIYAFDAGNISLVDVDLLAANAPGFSGNYETIDYATNKMTYLGFNLRSGACREQAIRLAIAQVIDRDSLCQIQLSSHAIATAQAIMPSSARYAAALEPDWSRASALALLEEAGYVRNEEGMLRYGSSSLTLKFAVCDENPFQAELARALAAQIEQLGITVELSYYSFSDYQKALSNGNFDLYLAQVKLLPDGDLSAVLFGSLNFGGYQSSTAQELLNNYLSAPEDGRTATLATLSEQLLEDVPITVLNFQTRSTLCLWGQISGVSPTQSNVFYHFSEWKR